LKKLEKYFARVEDSLGHDNAQQRLSAESLIRAQCRPRFIGSAQALIPNLTICRDDGGDP
jgi:hypothetical protein